MTPALVSALREALSGHTSERPISSVALAEKIGVANPQTLRAVIKYGRENHDLEIVSNSDGGYYAPTSGEDFSYSIADFKKRLDTMENTLHILERQQRDKARKMNLNYDNTVLRNLPLGEVA